MFLALYKPLVRPHLEYVSVILSPRYNTDAIQLENVQRRATTMLGYLGDKNYTEKLKELGIPTLEYRRQRADLLQS